MSSKRKNSSSSNFYSKINDLKNRVNSPVESERDYQNVDLFTQKSKISPIIKKIKGKIKNNKIINRKRNVANINKIKEFINDSNLFKENNKLKKYPGYIGLKKEIDKINKSSKSFVAPFNQKQKILQNNVINQINNLLINQENLSAKNMSEFINNKINFSAKTNSTINNNISNLKYNSLFNLIKRGNNNRKTIRRKYSYSNKKDIFNILNESNNIKTNTNINNELVHCLSSNYKNNELFDYTNIDNSSSRALRTLENNFNTRPKSNQKIKIMKLLHTHSSNHLTKATIIKCVYSSRNDIICTNNSFMSNCKYLNNSISPKNKEQKKSSKKRKDNSNIYQLIKSQSFHIHNKREERNTNKFISELNKSTSIHQKIERFDYDKENKNCNNIDDDFYLNKEKNKNNIYMIDDKGINEENTLKQKYCYRNTWKLKSSKSSFINMYYNNNYNSNRVFDMK